MSESVLSGAEFHSEEAAYAAIEAKLWPNGPVCPHCKTVDARIASKARALGSAFSNAQRVASSSTLR